MVDIISEKNIVTRISPVRETQNLPIEAFAIRLYRIFTGDRDLQGVFGRSGDFFGNTQHYSINPIRRLPLTDGGEVLIPFLRPVGEFPKISLIDVLNGAYPTDFFKNKAVLVGEYGTLIHDAHTSPIDIKTSMPGVEFHANMLESLLKNTPLQPLGLWSEVFLILLFAGVGFSLVVWARFWKCLVWVLVAPVGLFFLTAYLHTGQGILVNIWIIFFVGIFSPILGG